MFHKLVELRKTCGTYSHPLRWFASALVLLLAGCARSGELNIFGAYFPFWLLSLTVGAAAAFACRFLFVRLRIEPYLGPLTLIYLCITVSVACIVWLIFA